MLLVTCLTTYLTQMVPWVRAAAYHSRLTYVQDRLNHSVLGVGCPPIWLDLALLPVLLLLFLIPAIRLHYYGRALRYWLGCGCSTG
jgi:hypothetical protein